jgi:hypothetical protein
MYQFGMIVDMTMKINNSLMALTVAGFMISNVNANAMGGGNANGPDAYIGIVGAHLPINIQQAVITQHTVIQSTLQMM